MLESRGRSKEKALALRYIPELPAPFLMAKGEGRMAERLKAIAREAGVPVLSEEGLVDLLFPLDLGALVPVQFYEIVARLFASLRSIEET